MIKQQIERDLALCDEMNGKSWGDLIVTFMNDGLYNDEDFRILPLFLARARRQWPEYIQALQLALTDVVDPDIHQRVDELLHDKLAVFESRGE